MNENYAKKWASWRGIEDSGVLFHFFLFLICVEKFCERGKRVGIQGLKK